MKFLFVEIIFPLLILLFLRSLLRSIFAGFRAASVPQGRPREAPPVSIGGELKKDPVCGTYVSTVGSVSQKVISALPSVATNTGQRKSATRRRTAAPGPSVNFKTGGFYAKECDLSGPGTLARNATGSRGPVR
jgi:hypothetical protein